VTAATRGNRATRLLRLLFLVFAMVAFAAIGVFAYLAAANGPGSPNATAAVTSPVDGIVVSVDAVSLGEVRGFTLRALSGAVVTLELGTLENPTDFPPGHLAEHQATSSPIRAYFRVENGERVVYRLEDVTG
jgi:hypothetical protein